MKTFFFAILMSLALSNFAQNEIHVGVDWPECGLCLEDTSEFQNYQMKTMACGGPFITTGYPVWTNYWGGWMVNIININACPITINSFEARFQGTSGYRIYTKVGTFVGFQTTAGAWTLVGTAAGLTGISVVAPTPIPIAVNVTIPAGGTQAFYLTRTDNLVANRHLYVAGAGTAGTTIYATDGNLSVTEANYVDPFFAALQVGVRRPSFDACYTINCPLPIELISFEGECKNSVNTLAWKTASETNNDYFEIEKSQDGVTWEIIGRVDGAGNSTTYIDYQFKDPSLKELTYYRLNQVDFDGHHEYSNIIAVYNCVSKDKKLVKITNLMGQEIDPDTEGVLIYHYSDGSHQKMCKLK